jgi:hypothetical protein
MKIIPTRPLPAPDQEQAGRGADPLLVGQGGNRIGDDGALTLAGRTGRLSWCPEADAPSSVAPQD